LAIGVQEFYKLQQTTIEKKLTTLQRKEDSQVPTIKSYAKLGFFYEFTSDSGKVLEVFTRCYLTLCQFVFQVKKSFNIWEIKSFADVIMLKLLKIEVSPRQTYERLRIHYATFKQSTKEINSVLEYLVNHQGNHRSISGERCI